MEPEGKSSGTGQGGILVVPPGADGGGKQWGAWSRATLLVPEAEEV